jgi:opacity protein-like surface antigen
VKLILMMLVVALLPATVMAQSPDPSPVEPRFVLLAGTGFGTTWDDEGMLGHGLGLSAAAAAGMRVGRFTIFGLVDQVSYYRDVDWLTFDGRVVFVGAELGSQFGSGRTRPYVTFGAGVLNDDGIWVRKIQAGPSQPRIEERTDREGTRAAMTSSVGMEVGVAPRVSLRGGLRFYGLLANLHGALDAQLGHDAFPHIVLQPTVAAVLRF